MDAYELPSSVVGDSASVNPGILSFGSAYTRLTRPVHALRSISRMGVTRSMVFILLLAGEGRFPLVSSTSNAFEKGLS
jgi:hypothetical protein